ncbi:MAG: type II toxin-antitoxin system RelE/ParE family toxin [Acidobacteria bacterium]|nr:type II toxin-antitoxin system RelE/ParE family toxin [Acidobacteriota bacterium]
MSFKVEFRPAARLEFDEAADWYEEQQPGLRAEFVREIDSVVSRIADRPLSFPVVQGSGIRRALVGRFPYAVLFEVSDELLVVHALFHTSRNPMIWRGRID